MSFSFLFNNPKARVVNSYLIQDKAWKRWFWCFLPLVSLLFTLTAHSAPVTRYIHTDPMGSPIAATDENGEILWVEDYKPYGERIRKEEKSAPHKRWYTGHVQDDDTGLIYMGARYYDPEIGRFLSPDPVGFDPENPVSFNKYAYANNNPYRYTDPDGRSVIAVALLAYAAFEVASVGYDSYPATTTLMDSGASDQEKAMAVGLVVAGIGLPGPGRAYKESAEFFCKKYRRLCRPCFVTASSTHS
ncbi:MAG: RHS repeat domain-containing protein [Pseudomonadota bacterium]